MNRFLFVFATIVVAVSARAGRQGWPAPTTAPPPPPPTTGWPAPPPTTLPPSGWPAPTVAPGWPAPAPAPGWQPAPPSTLAVNLDGELAGAGSGWAASSQSAELQAISDHPDSVDPSAILQHGNINQASGIIPTNIAAAQAIDVSHAAIGAQSIDAFAIGGNLASIGVSGWSGAAGEATSSADGTVSAVAN
ncbi:unnamed protein product [Orchesella dallaii]|uniref:Uncharacterized protein n=1 Tax=Orchesella dallaii TaxID=48710 RepID=A0ABP1QXN9_9HEXA